MNTISKIIIRSIGTGLVWGMLLTVGAAMELRPVGLRTENRENPLGVDKVPPRLSWRLESTKRDDAQSAYQIFAATAPERLTETDADLWNSGKITSAESIQIPYAGRPLASEQRVFWKVRVWDRTGQKFRDSAPAWFETALLSQTNWQATWITRPLPPEPKTDFYQDDPSPLFRKTFTVPTNKKIQRARVHVSGLGYYELSLNGERVGDHQLDPGWTSYAHRVLYSTYDVTAQLRPGRNALGLQLGNGWFNPLPLRLWGWLNLREHLTIGAPRAILQLRIDYTDGTTQTVVTDETWKVGAGPVLRNNVYLGEVYDARREIAGWDTPDFDDAGWPTAVRATEPRLGPLRVQSAPPIRITHTLRPILLTEPRPGVYIFDFGQNFAGWVRLRVQGPAGTRVTMRFGELLYPDGTLNGMTAVCGQIKRGGKDYRYNGKGEPQTAFQQDEYILKGDGLETYTPRFTFHGFRYVEVTGFPGRPDERTLEGLRLNSAVPVAGAFECSNELFNRIQRMVLWTKLSNLFSVQSDCPHREKFGYGGDIAAASEMGMLNFDLANFYAKAVEDLRDAARANGGFTETAPFVGIADESLGDQSGPIGWGTAQPLLLWQLYQYYGDRQLMAEHYEATQKWIALLRTREQDGILNNGIGDHESLVPKPRALTGTAFYYYNLQLFTQIARALGRTADAELAEQDAARVRLAFNKKFLRPGTGRFDSGTQAAQAFALFFGLVPTEEVAGALTVLTNDIAARDTHLSTGIFGTKYLLHTLAEHGRADLAYALVNQRTFPGWGYMLERGATTLWEHWVFSDNTYSHNHPMFGSVSEWFYKVIGGIAPAPDAVGFNRILIRPQPVGDLTWANTHYDSVRGRIATAWRKSDTQFDLDVTIPVGSTARVFLPVRNPAQLQESHQPIERAPGVRLIRFSAGQAELEIGSGSYRFTSMLK